MYRAASFIRNAAIE
jgi:hypothetical protein